MNLAYELSQFKTQCIYFTEPKQNTVIPNSNFIRILYSTPDVIMTGAFLHIRLYTTHVDKHFNTYSFSFDASYEPNQLMIRNLRYIEESILKKRITSKSPCYNITNQLETGHLNIWLSSDINEKKNVHDFVLKISGIWENDTQNEYGLTYKYI